MIHAYDKLYLSVAQKNLACMLDYMVNDLKRPLETVWQWFCMSNTASRFERGDCSVVAGMSGVEIAYEVLQEAGEPKPEQAPSYSYDRSPEYWTGWALAYYQWSTSLSFAEINQAIPVTEVRMLYTPLYREAKPETNLKELRTFANLSQSELAQQAGVSVRTIQQYEQRRKDINKAQTETLLKIARALVCTVEDLVEKVPT